MLEQENYLLPFLRTMYRSGTPFSNLNHLFGGSKRMMGELVAGPPSVDPGHLYFAL